MDFGGPFGFPCKTYKNGGGRGGGAGVTPKKESPMLQKVDSWKFPPSDFLGHQLIDQEELGGSHLASV